MRAPDEIIGHPPYMLRWIIFKPRAFRRVAKMVTEGRRDVIKYIEVAKAKIYLPSVYLHNFKRSDDDRHFHDHVGWSVSIVLPSWLLRLFGIRGGGAGYWELTPDISTSGRRRNPALVSRVGRVWRWRGPGSITFRAADQPHIIALGCTITRDRDDNIVQRIPTNVAPHDVGIWSLWIRGPWRREWGFYREDGWIPWEQYIEESKRGTYKSKAPA